MKNIVLLIFLCFASFAPANSLLAQSSSADQQVIELTPDELKAMIRKMAELRRQRVLMWQRQQMMMRRRGATKDKPAESSTIETRIVIREYEGGRVDTTIYVSEGPPPTSKLVRTERDTAVYSPSAKNAFAPVDNTADLADLRRRLDRQEQLLLDIRDRSLMAAVSPAPTRSDTIIQQIMLNQREDKGANLSKDDLEALTTEVSRMNIELNSLRRRLADEEERRRRAEDDVRRALDRDDRTESWESERLRYERDLNRARREERTVNVPTPVVIEKEAPVRIVRDTVYVDRVTTTPVFIPTEGRTDTVVIVKETAPAIIRDTVTVEREREVTRTDTLQLRAFEPLEFPTIFFDNNSSRLNAAHRALIAAAAVQLKDKTNYIVRLTGFASPSGNADYNQELSAKRADAVRQGFENAGLSGDRIVVVPGGIDFKPATAAAARRVEVQALPR